jgi:hypothetical protein
MSLMQLYLPLTWDLSRSKVHNLFPLAKSLGGWVRARNFVGNFLRAMGLYKNLEGETEML